MKNVKIKQFRPNLTVTNLNDGISFYRDIFGFQLIHSDEQARFSLLSKDDVELALLEADRNAKQSAYLYVEDVETLYQHCIACDVNINIHLQTHDYGIADFTLIDAFENIISIGERI